jgi:CHASE2 domain-containing sensor protein
MFAQLRFSLTRLSMQLVERLSNSFYLYLAVLLSLLILLDASVFHVGENMRQKAFDLVVRSRIATPKPDPNIVIVDVNEKSLAALAADYGRWPWPRQVFAEFLENIEKQHPKAIVFDILFSDADLFNPDSDTYFNDTIAGTDNTYFPLLRLDASQDALSQIKPSMIAGVTKLKNAKADASIALVLPHFDAVLKNGRLGTHNIYPDPDGISREYRLYHDDYGWKLPSLPLSIAQTLGYKTINEQNMLLNWRGGPFTYQNVSFSDVYHDLTAKTPKRPSNEFTGKIVIIGSTAPSLFDIKATAMSRAHPGVEILATAVDNLKHGDHLKVWRGALPYAAFSLLLLWLTAIGFYREVERERFDKLFGFSQIGLLAVSYVGLNLSNFYLDLTAPVTWAVIYFSIAKIYALATERAMQRVLAKNTQHLDGNTSAVIMLIMLETPYPLGDATLKVLCRAIEKPDIEITILKSSQAGVWGLFSEVLLVTWTTSESTAARMEQVLSSLSTAVQQKNLPVTRIRHALHQAPLHASSENAKLWRTLFAEAILKLEESS